MTGPFMSVYHMLACLPIISQEQKYIFTNLGCGIKLCLVNNDKVMGDQITLPEVLPSTLHRSFRASDSGVRARR